MKLPVLIIALAAVSVAVMACKPQAADSTAPASAAVVFKGSGVSLAPGGDWIQVGGGDFSGAAPDGICLPTLAGKTGLIQVLLLPPDRSDPQAVAAGMRTAFDADPAAIKDSFKQESITVQSGAPVIHVSSSEQPGKEGSGESRIHHYIVANKAGRAVAINFIGVAPSDADAVHQMIRQTLKVE